MVMKNDYGLKDGGGVKDKTHVVYDCNEEVLKHFYARHRRKLV